MTKVISINGAHTRGVRDVAFNVDQPPAPGVMERVKYGSLQISWEEENQVLRVRVPKDEEVLGTGAIVNLNGKLATADLELKNEQARAAEVHENNLRVLSQSTGLQVK